MEGKKIISFVDLFAWQKGHSLVRHIYNITKTFPKEEIFCLTSQMRRAAISITSNIAEGFCRNTMKEKVNFYSISLGSLTEIQNQLLIAKDIGYISQENFIPIYELSIETNKILNGLIKKIKSQSPPLPP